MYRSLLTALGAILALWLVLGFWPLSTGSRVALGLLVALAAGVIFWCQRRGSLARATAVREIVDESLPPEDFQGAVIFVCGDNALLFVSGTPAGLVSVGKGCRATTALCTAPEFGAPGSGVANLGHAGGCA
jgi:hypothetical protein